MKKTTDLLKKEILKHVPALTVAYIKATERSFNRLAAKYGSSDTLNNINALIDSFNSKLSEPLDKEFRAKLNKSLSIVTAARAEYQGIAAHVIKGSLSEDSLTAAAKSWAEAAVEAWLPKMEAKLGSLDSILYSAFNGSEYSVTAVKAGKKVELRQQIVRVYRRSGIVYQYPSRLYVNNIFTPKAAYDKMFNTSDTPEDYNIKLRCVYVSARAGRYAMVNSVKAGRVICRLSPNTSGLYSGGWSRITIEEWQRYNFNLLNR